MKLEKLTYNLTNKIINYKRKTGQHNMSRNKTNRLLDKTIFNKVALNNILSQSPTPTHVGCTYYYQILNLIKYQQIPLLNIQFHLNYKCTRNTTY